MLIAIYIYARLIQIFFYSAVAGVVRQGGGSSATQVCDVLTHVVHSDMNIAVADAAILQLKRHIVYSREVALDAERGKGRFLAGLGPGKCLVQLTRHLKQKL